MTDPRERVVRMLDGIGFQPELTADRTAIRLRHCPFHELARHQPEIVCGIHLWLIRGALRQLGAPAEATRLVPFATRRLCVVELGVPSTPEYNAVGPRGTVAYWGVADVDAVVAEWVAHGASVHRGPIGGRRLSRPAIGCVSRQRSPNTEAGRDGRAALGDKCCLAQATTPPDFIWEQLGVRNRPRCACWAGVIACARSRSTSGPFDRAQTRRSIVTLTITRTPGPDE